MTHVTNACIQVLNQLEAAMADISHEDYKRPSTVLGGATIGQHVRHTIEFFGCLEHGYKTGVVNYDDRAHNREIETHKESSLSAIREVRRFIEAMPPGKSLLLQVDYTREGTMPQRLDTTYLRELAYNLEHVIHHMAIIKIGLQDVAPYVVLPKHFGVAVSTIRHSAMEAERQAFVST